MRFSYCPGWVDICAVQPCTQLNNNACTSWAWELGHIISAPKVSLCCLSQWTCVTWRWIYRPDLCVTGMEHERFPGFLSSSFHLLIQTRFTSALQPPNHVATISLFQRAGWTGRSCRPAGMCCVNRSEIWSCSVCRRSETSSSTSETELATTACLGTYDCCFVTNWFSRGRCAYTMLSD